MAGAWSQNSTQVLIAAAVFSLSPARLDPVLQLLALIRALCSGREPHVIHGGPTVRAGRHIVVDVGVTRLDLHDGQCHYRITRHATPLEVPGHGPVAAHVTVARDEHGPGWARMGQQA